MFYSYVGQTLITFHFFGGGGCCLPPFPWTDHCHFGAEHKAQLQGPVHLLGAQLQAA